MCVYLCMYEDVCVRMCVCGQYCRGILLTPVCPTPACSSRVRQLQLLFTPVQSSALSSPPPTVLLFFFSSIILFFCYCVHKQCSSSSASSNQPLLWCLYCYRYCCCWSPTSFLIQLQLVFSKPTSIFVWKAVVQLSRNAQNESAFATLIVPCCRALRIVQAKRHLQLGTPARLC
ncbi:hypothetical protein GQ42DRAFT_11851 [Ramicandelaber brevisporus]|nr:hypothetical protein GQ42DRAFT_11851 [Ramicandelaber brevisporus]